MSTKQAAEGSAEGQPTAALSYPAAVGAVLQALRKVRLADQAELGRAVGLGIAAWSKIENGQTAVTVEQLALAACELETTPAEILALAEEWFIEAAKHGVAATATRLSIDSKTAAKIAPVSGLAVLASTAGIVPALGLPLLAGTAAIKLILGELRTRKASKAFLQFKAAMEQRSVTTGDASSSG